MNCHNCGYPTISQDGRPINCACVLVFCPDGAERSGVPQGCLPSTTGSASAAPPEAGAVKSQSAPMASLPPTVERKMDSALINSVVQLPASGPSGTELLPCPFCNSRMVVLSPPVNDADESDFVLAGWQVVCRECGTVGGSRPSEIGATNLWNTRAGLEASAPTADPAQRV